MRVNRAAVGACDCEERAATTVAELVRGWVGHAAFAAEDLVRIPHGLFHLEAHPGFDLPMLDLKPPKLGISVSSGRLSRTFAWSICPFGCSDDLGGRMRTGPGKVAAACRT